MGRNIIGVSNVTINKRLCKHNVAKYVTLITETPIFTQLLCTFSEK